MGPRAGVFCQNALGDGILGLVLSNNLQLNGFEVHTYQNTMVYLQNWFPHLTVSTYPTMEELPKILQAYDWYFVVWDNGNDFIKKLVAEGKRRFPERMKVIYLYPSTSIVNEPYYSDCLTDPAASVPKIMRTICEKVMHLPKITKSSGFIAPEGLTFRKHAKRVIIHPTSSKASKNWDKDKYVKLALHLKKQGFQPVFIPGPSEFEQWKDLLDLGLEVADFPSLDAIARFIYESGYLIGNDSGLGHLASALGIRTMTICRRKSVAKMWAPAFVSGVILTPSSLIPNIRGLRLRDLHWQKFITVNMARRGFEKLITSQ
jgi:hypothetical protein